MTYVVAVMGQDEGYSVGQTVGRDVSSTASIRGMEGLISNIRKGFDSTMFNGSQEKPTDGRQNGLGYLHTIIQQSFLLARFRLNIF